MERDRAIVAGGFFGRRRTDGAPLLQEMAEPGFGELRRKWFYGREIFK